MSIYITQSVHANAREDDRMRDLVMCKLRLKPTRVTCTAPALAQRDLDMTM